MQPLAVEPSVGTQAWWANPERVDAASDPDQATAQTIRIMCRHAAKSAGDPLVQGTADRAVQQFGGLAGFDTSDAESIACAAWYWCKTFIKFVHHEFLLRQHLGEGGHLQGLISPDALVRMARPEGDCAIFTECLCSFLKVFGVPFEMVTVAVNPNEPDVFSHVYLYAVMPDGSRLPLDASHGQYPGWQVPSSDVFRRQVWDEDGRPVADRGSRFGGLGNYAMRGLGDSITLPDGTQLDVPPPAGYDPTTPIYNDQTPYYNPTQVFGPGIANSGFTTLPPAGSSALSSEISSLLNQWSQIGGRVVAPQTTYTVGPGGQVSYSTPGAAPPPTGLPSLTSLGGSSSLLLFGGLAVAALLLMGKK